MKRKTVFYIFLGLLFLILIGSIGGIIYFKNSFFKERPNYLSFTEELKSIDFIWAKDSIGNHVEHYDAMLLPIHFEGIAKKLYVQFDLGAPYSVFYKSALESFLEKGKTYQYENEGDKTFIENLQFNIAENNMIYKKARIMDYGSPINWKDSTDIEIVGTIGSDFIADKVVSIDFKNRLINLFKERPNRFIDLTFTPFQFKGRRIMLPASIDGKSVQLFYDSGSSAFGLLTSKKYFEKYSDKNSDETVLMANSWGDSIPVHHKLSSKKIEIGGAVLNLRRTSYVEWNNWLQSIGLGFTNIKGVLGNIIFLESTLVLDTNKNEFLVISK